MPRKFWPTNSLMRDSPVKRWSTLCFSQISLMSSAQASKASSSERTRVLSQSKRRVVIWAVSGGKSLRRKLTYLRHVGGLGVLSNRGGVRFLARSIGTVVKLFTERKSCLPRWHVVVVRGTRERTYQRRQVKLEEERKVGRWELGALGCISGTRGNLRYRSKMSAGQANGPSRQRAKMAQAETGPSDPRFDVITGGTSTRGEDESLGRRRNMTCTWTLDGL